MEIKINNRAADITADDEKTVGEIMAGLDLWLADSGHILSGLSVNGKAADISRLDEVFSTPIDSVKTLDVYTNSLAELAASSLVSLLTDIQNYEKLNFEEKNKFTDNWKESAEGRFLSEQMSDLYSLAVNVFSGGGSLQMLRSIAEEWLREITEPASEFANLSLIIEEICARLVDLPLDTQTGKDVRAAQTIQIFSGVVEKIFRCFRQFDIQGYLSRRADEKQVTLRLIGEFGETVKELLAAYERHDSVIVGDLAEYEMAPRLRELYEAIAKNSREAEEGGRVLE